MKINQWTVGLAAVGVVSLGSLAMAEEANNQVLTALSATTLSGYVDTSAIWNFDSGANLLAGRFNDAGPEFGPNSKQDGFNMNVVGLSLAKPLDEGSWSAGYNVDLLFGPDANIYGGNSFGANASDFNIQNAYITLRAPVGNGIDFQMGYWGTIVGYEVQNPTSNPNFSRSFGFSMEPFQHTGVLASYQVNDMIGLVAGVSESTATQINLRSGHDSTKSYLGGISITAPESLGFLEGATLYGAIIDGGNVGSPDTQWYYVGGSAPTPIEGLSVGFAWDYVKDAFSTPLASGDQWALAGYLSYQATDKLALHGRLDYAEADGGFGGVLGSNFTSSTGDNTDLFSITLTAEYALWNNVLSRVELRHDMADEDVFGGAEGTFVGTDDNATTLALQLVYQF
jgi:hypothetical protein